MKNLYNTPEIKVEELTKTDVLCDSEEKVDNYTGEYTTQSLWDALTNWNI